MMERGHCWATWKHAPHPYPVGPLESYEVLLCTGTSLDEIASR